VTRIKSQVELLEEISRKLDTITGFLAVRDISDPATQIEVLYAMRLHPRQIATVVKMSENAVAVRLSRMKRKSPRN
jgi:hypothetical protein